MSLVAIDPGLRGCGVALFETDGCRPHLVSAKYVANPEKALTGPVAWARMAAEVIIHGAPSAHIRSRVALKDTKAALLWPKLAEEHWPSVLVLEHPLVYPGVRNEDPNDLIQLAGVLGAIIAHWESVPTIVAYYPAAWKGQVPKKVMTERIRKHLAPGEAERIISAGAKDHNTLDAVGLGLFQLGRMKRGGA